MSESVFSKQLQTLRKEKGITQEQLAGVLGVSAQAVSKWENGSYPEGDLLPKLADYFEVSIDELYGRNTKNKSAEDYILDDLGKYKFHSPNASFPTENEPLKDDYGFFDCLFDYYWVLQCSAWRDNMSHSKRPRHPDATYGVTVSHLANNAGFTYMRLNGDLEYYFAVKEPRDGFAQRLQPTKELADAFAFLGDLDHLRILHFLFSLQNFECIEPSALAKKLNISEKKVTSAMETLKKCSRSGQPFIYGIDIIDEKHATRPAYSINNIGAAAFLMVLCAMDMYMDLPGSFSLQVASRDKAWMNESKSEDSKTSENK